MDLSLYINTAEPDPRLALVTSIADLTRRPMPLLTRGDTMNLTIVLVKADGTVDPRSGGAGLSAALTLGAPGYDPIAQATNFAALTAPGRWTCTLDTSSDALTMLLRSSVRPSLVLSFFTFSSAGGRSSWLAVDCPVLDASDVDTADLTFSLPSTMPSTFQPAFVELDTGPARLQLLNVSAADAGKILQGTVAGELKSYQVRSGTDAEAIPGIVHPANYDAVINAYVFVQL